MVKIFINLLKQFYPIIKIEKKCLNNTKINRKFIKLLNIIDKYFLYDIFIMLFLHLLFDKNLRSEGGGTVAAKPFWKSRDRKRKRIVWTGIFVI